MKDIKIKSVHNFRSLNNIPTNCNGKIKSSCFYRSARLDKLSIKDKNKLKLLNINTIIDYRHHSECIAHPTGKLSKIEICNVPAFSTNREYKSYEILQHILNNDYQMLKETIVLDYQNTIFKNRAFLFMLNKVKEMKEGALIQHCDDGCHRTGMAITLLLLLLNVDEKEIIKDYLISKESLISFNDTLYDGYPFLKDQKEQVIKISQPKANNLILLFDAIKQKYDTYNDFFNAEYGLDSTTIEAIRQFYIEYE